MNLNVGCIAARYSRSTPRCVPFFYELNVDYKQSPFRSNYRYVCIQNFNYESIVLKEIRIFGPGLHKRIIFGLTLSGIDRSLFVLRVIILLCFALLHSIFIACRFYEINL